MTMSFRAGLPLLVCLMSASLVALAEPAVNSPPDTVQPGTSSSTEMGVLQEVVVTAEKRAEPLQNVPEAVSALSGAALEALGAASFTDYARTIPGLTFTDLGNGRQAVSLRGLNSSIGADTVGYYIGEIPLESAHAGASDISNYGGSAVDPYLVDIDRVEVLRGPQGTLYGSSSVGGTVKLIPNEPNLTAFEGSVSSTGQITQGEGGSAPGGEADLVLNVPIVSGVAAVRADVWGRDIDGFINRTYGYAGEFGSPTPLPQGTVKNIPDEHTWGMRTTALVAPVAGLKISAMVYLQNQHFNGFQDITGGATNPDNRLEQMLISDVPEPQDNRFTLYGLTASYDFDRFQFLSATGYHTNYSEVQEEGTSATVLLPILFGVSNSYASPFPNAAQITIDMHSFTEEARLSTTESIYGFDAVVGVFYSNNGQNEHFYWSPSQYNSVEAGNDPTNPLYAPGDDVFGDFLPAFERQTAEFGELTYHLTHALRATVGLRHFEVKNGETLEENGLFAGNTTAISSFSATSVGTVHKVNLSYDITNDHLVYAQYSEGFRPGFGNAPAPDFCNADVPRVVNPDTIKQYELGAKTQWLDRRLTINTAVYRINWSNIQQSVELPCGFAYDDNSGDAVIKGVDLEINGQLTDRVSAGVSGSYISARLQQNTPPNVCLTTGSCAMAGDQIEGVPNWQYALFAQTTLPLLRHDDGFARLDYQYTGHSFAEYIRQVEADGTPVGPIDPNYEIQSLRLLNFKTGMRHDGWEVSVGAQNLLNQVAHESVDPFANITIAIPGRPRYVVNRPRTFLLNMRYRF